MLNWNKEWLNSENAKEAKQEIQRIKNERSKVEPSPVGYQHEFASPIPLQTTELTKRLFIQCWRDPTCLYGKLFVSVIVGIFNGFTFWQLRCSITDMHTGCSHPFRLYSFLPSWSTLWFPSSPGTELFWKRENSLPEFMAE